MRFLLSPLLVVALAVQAAGSLGGAFFCRALGERLADCCCPDDEVAATGPELLSASCCDVLRAVAPESVAQEQGPGPEKVPSRSTVALEVPPPGPSLATAAPGPAFRAAGRASGPPGQAPVFLSLKQLLL